MTENEARELEVGAKVYWDQDEEDTGVVTEKGFGGFLVKWDNGFVGWIDYKDAAKIHKKEAR